MVVVKGPIWSVTASVKGLIPLLLALLKGKLDPTPKASRFAELDHELGVKGEERDARRRHNGHGNGRIHRDVSHQRVAGRGDYRNAGGIVTRDVDVFAVRGDGDPFGAQVSPERGRHCVRGRVDTVSITETVLMLPFVT
jgi:hypothetical protein